MHKFHPSFFIHGNFYLHWNGHRQAGAEGSASAERATKEWHLSGSVPLRIEQASFQEEERRVIHKELKQHQRLIYKQLKQEQMMVINGRIMQDRAAEVLWEGPKRKGKGQWTGFGQ